MPPLEAPGAALPWCQTTWLTRQGPWWLASLALVAVSALAALTQAYCATAFTLTSALRIGILGASPLVVRWLLPKISLWHVALGAGVLLGLAAASLVLRSHYRYRTAAQMDLPIREYSNVEYPEDPASRSLHFGQYNGRILRLVRTGVTKFDFIFEPRHD